MTVTDAQMKEWEDLIQGEEYFEQKEVEDWASQLIVVVRELRARLKRMEWTGLLHMTYHCCYICGGLKPGEVRDRDDLPEHGHTDDCELKADLG